MELNSQLPLPKLGTTAPSPCQDFSLSLHYLAKSEVSHSTNWPQPPSFARAPGTGCVAWISIACPAVSRLTN